MNNPDRETKGEEGGGGDWKVNRKKKNTFWTVSFLPVFTQFVYCGRRRLRRDCYLQYEVMQQCLGEKEVNEMKGQSYVVFARQHFW